MPISQSVRKAPLTRLPAASKTTSLGKRALSAALAVVCLLATVLLGTNSAHAQTAQFSYPQTFFSGSNAYSTAVDSLGNIYLSIPGSNEVVKETLTSGFPGGTYTQSVVANHASNGLSNPAGIAVDSSGNIYIADQGNSRVLKETYSSGSYSQSVITSTPSGPYGVAVDATGNVYVADTGHSEILKETYNSGTNTYAESVLFNIARNGLSGPYGVAVDVVGNIFIADTGNNRVLDEKFISNNYTQAVLSTPTLDAPEDVSVDYIGNIFISDTGDSQFIELLSDGDNNYDSGLVLANTALNGLGKPTSVAVDASGNQYIVDATNQDLLLLQTLSVNVGQVALGSSTTFTLTYTAIVSGTLSVPSVVTQGQTGYDFTDLQTGTCYTNGASYSYGVGQHCTEVLKFAPKFATGMRLGALQTTISNSTATVDLFGTGTAAQVAYIPGTIQTVAGDATVCSSGGSACGDNGLATSANFNQPEGVLVDPAGNIYIADTYDNRVREVLASTGNIQTIAGTGAVCSSPTATCGDNAAASQAELNQPTALAMDGAGNLYIADTGDNRIREVTPGQTITTVAGTGNTTYNSVSYASTANIKSPSGIAVDGAGNLYISDSNQRIRKVNYAGLISTVAGNGTKCSLATAACGDGSSATSANLNGPSGLAVDSNDNLYILDQGDLRVREVSVSTGNINTVAGSGTYGANTGDGGPATSATFEDPVGLAVDAAGDIYITTGQAIREVFAGTGIITTVAGVAQNGYNGDGIAATSAELYNPEAVALDGAGDIYIADASNSRIREVQVGNVPTLSFPTATLIGTTDTTDPAQVVTAVNIGNQPLSLLTPSSGNLNPSISTADFTLTNLGSTGACPQINSTDSASLLNTGNDCTLSVEFTPTTSGAGTKTATLSITGNPLNATSATTNINLSGTASSTTATHFVITSPDYGSNPPWYTAFSIVITAYDASNNVATSYNGSVNLTSTSARFSAASPIALTNGTVATTIGLGNSGMQSVTATDTVNSAITGSFTFTIPPGPPSAITVSAPSSTYAGAPLSVTVTANDVVGNVATSYTGTVAFTSTDNAAVLPANYTFVAADNGTHTFSATLNTIGTKTITATDSANSFTATSANITVNADPTYTVTALGDETFPNPGVPANCPTPSTGTTCKLRDALAAAAAFESSNPGVPVIVNFSSALALPATIVPNTNLTVPNNTTLQGPTSGSGASLTNLMTLDGANGNSLLFVASGTTVTINNLNLTRGYGFNGGALSLQGNATVNGSSFTQNQVQDYGGAIFVANSSTLTINKSTFSGNTAQASGGAIFSSYPVTITDSTFTGNSSPNISAVAVASTLTMIGDTISGNTVSGGNTKGAIVGAPANLSNSIVSGNIGGDVDSTYTDNGGNQVTVSNINLTALGSYGGPTQTMLPLPGSPALCGGLIAQIASGDTTDERGYPRTTTYNTTPCVDSGAAQTNYSLQFVQQPEHSVTTFTMDPSPSVQVYDAGSVVASAGASISISATAGTLTGTSPQTTGSNGIATFGDLVISTSETGDTLIATMPVGSNSVSITSNPFNVDPSDSTHTATSVSLSAPVNGLQQTLTATVTDLTHTGTIPVGTVTFTDTNTTTTAVVTYGPYTLNGSGTASTPAFSPTLGTHTVTTTFTPTNDMLFAASADSIGQTYTMSPYGNIAKFEIVPTANPEYIGTPDTITLTALDAENNTVLNYAGTATLTSTTDTAATFTGSPISFTNGIGTATATFGTLGNQTVTATDNTSTYTGISPGILINADPAYVVTSIADDATGVASHCPIPSTGTNCELRDAIAAAAAIQTSNPGTPITITFKTGLAGTISITTGGVLTVPNNTTILGSTLGSGPSLTNQIDVDGGNTKQIFAIPSGVTAVISNLNIAHGSDGGSNKGGAIYDAGTLTTNGVNFKADAGNTNGGGGIYVDSGTLTVNNGTFEDDTASSSQGGAIYGVNATLNINNSTLAYNSANFGGAISSTDSILTIINSTLTQNSATNGQGGIFSNGTQTTLTGDTITANTSTSGGALYIEDTMANVANTILSGNTGGDFGNAASTLNDNGGNQIAVSGINLSALGNYGNISPLQTMMPLPGSPAICAGVIANIPSGDTTDERGEPRTTTYTTPCVDAGAAQTNYSLGFVQQPTDTITSAVISPYPTVQLYDNGSPIALASVPISINSDIGRFSGTTPQPTNSAGLSTFNDISVSLSSGIMAGDRLAASIAAGSNTISTMSNAFQIIPLDTTKTVTGETGNSLANGQTQSVSATVTDTSNTGTIPVGTVTFTDTNTTTSTSVQYGPYTVNGSGVATSATYTPTIGTHIVTSAFTPTSSTNFTTSSDTQGALYTVAAYGAAASFTVVPSTTTEYVGSPDTITVTAIDAEGNIITNFSGATTLTSSDTSATITGSPLVFSSGVATATVAFSTTGDPTVSATSTSITGTSAQITVNADPDYVVTNLNDVSTGNAANCPIPSTGTTCSLRDAVAAATATESSYPNTPISITFAGTLSGTITVSSGNLQLPNDISIIGPAAGGITISGGNSNEIFSTSSGSTASISNLTIANGKTSVAGGAIFSRGPLTVTNCIFTNNESTSNNGGAIYSGGTLTVTNSSFNGNGAQSGGAIYLSSGGATVTNTTFSGNIATNYGGAIEVSTTGTLTVSNSTFYNNSNSSTINGGGGAIAVLSGTIVNIYNSTFSANSSYNIFGAALYGPNGTLNLLNNLFTANGAGYAVQAANGNLNLSISNVFTGDTGGECNNNNCPSNGLNGNIVGTSTTSGNISAIGNYGGPTQTIMPLPNSPAICAGNVSFILTGDTTDQRGNPRTANSCVDAGAVQTNYSLQFVQQPTDTDETVDISPSPTVQLYDNSVPIALPGASIGITAAAGTLSGTTPQTTDSTGLATFTDLTIATLETNDTLTASVTNSGSITSNDFNITLPYGPLATFGVAVTTSPVNTGVTDLVTVTALDSNGKTVLNYTGTATLSSTDNTATFTGSPISFTNGVGTAASVTFGKGGNQKVIATDNTNTYSGISGTVVVNQSPVLSLTKTHTGTFTQGGTAQWNITVHNTGAESTTSGTVTVSDVLPTGYTVANFGTTSPTWTCTGSTTVTCASTQAVLGIGTFPVIQVVVNVPAASPILISNTASVYGGNDPVHSSSGTAATGSDSNIGVTQVPASISINSGNNQSATVNTAFANNLSVTVKDAAGAVIANSPVTFTIPTTGASITGTSDTTSTNGSGQASILATANTMAGSYQITASDSPAASVNFNLTNTAGPLAAYSVGANTPIYLGQLSIISVTAVDPFGNTLTGYTTSTTTTLTSSTDPSAAITGSPLIFTNGVAYGSVTFNATGNQTITANDTTHSITANSNTIEVEPDPTYTVTTLNDDSTGNAANCPGTACTLRDALAAASAFETTYPTVPVMVNFTSTLSGTITVTTGGTLNLPSNTTIQGTTNPTTGANQITINGAGSVQLFIVSSGVSGEAINNLDLVNGKPGTSLVGAAIFSSGSLSVNNINFTGNSGSIAGGAIYFGSSNTTLNVSNSTFLNNSSTNNGGAIYIGAGATASITNSTFTGNTSNSGGAISAINANGTLTGNTISGNVSSSSTGGGIYVTSGSVTLANNIISGNTGGDVFGAYTDNGGNQVTVSNINLSALGNYGGPTQTFIPLPNSPAICAGLNENIPNNDSTDQRGDSRTTNGCVDAGAVQTNYSLAFMQQPTNTNTSATITPFPTVQLDESGAPIALPGVPISISAAAGTLRVTTPESTGSTGLVTFSGLSILTGETNDTLTASITAGGNTISTTSNQFNITAPDSTTTATGDTSSSLVYGQQQAFSATVKDASNTGTVPVGTVTFTDTNTTTSTVLNYGPYAVNNSGVASAPAFTPTIGAHTVTAAFTPTSTASFNGSSDTVGVNYSVAAFGTLASFTVVPQITNEFIASPDTITVTALDAESNIITNFAGATTLTSSDTRATITGSPLSFSNGIATGTIAFATTGNQTAIATDGGIIGTSANINVKADPTYTVTNLNDDATGVIANCPIPSSGTTCTLRDAIAAATSIETSNPATPVTITFAPALSGTITTTTGGTLVLPTNTTLQGSTSGSGAALTNLITISGGNAVQIFTVPIGEKGVVISSLNIINGSSSSGDGAAAIYSLGGLTVSNSNFSGNNATAGYGGAISSYAVPPLTISNCTFSSNSAQSDGGAVSVRNGPVTITNSTFTGNTSAGHGGALVVQNASVTLVGNTITANTSTLSSTSGGGLALIVGRMTMANNIISGNTATDIYQSGAFTLTDNGGNQIANSNINLSALGNFGGPTQTMLPLPGSAALCGGLIAQIPTGDTTDQRGLPRTTTYSSTPCVDSGAAQTNYTIGFSQQPTKTDIGIDIAPAPTVQLSENGSPIALGNAPVSISAASGTLSGTTPESTNSTGLATFADLSIPTVETNDTLTASITAGSNTITTTSNQFNEVEPLTSFTFTAIPTLATQTIPFSFTVNAYNGASISTGYLGTVYFTMSDNNGGFTTTSYTFTAGDAGSHTFTNFAHFATTGQQTITVTDSVANVSQTSANIQVNPLVTAFTITAIPTTVIAGAPFSYTITAYANSNVATLYNGTVNFTMSDTKGSFTTSSYTFVAGDNGVHTFTNNATFDTSGQQTITVKDPVANVSQQSANITVNAAAPSTTALTSGSGQTATIGAGYANPLVVTIKDTYGNLVPNATVTYSVVATGASVTFTGGIAGSLTTAGGIESVNAVTNSSGQASVGAIADATAGGFNITAAASGTTPVSFGLSNTKATPNVLLASSVNPVLYSNPTTLTATVSYSVGTPTGNVIFYDGSTPLQTVGLINGVATLIDSTLAVGSHSLTAVYQSDSNFNLNGSNTVPQTVEDFSLNISGGSVGTATVAPGSEATYQFTISPLAPATTFPSNITLSLTGLPAGATYTFMPNPITAGSGATTETLNITTPITSLAHNQQPSNNDLNRKAALGSGMMLALLLLPFTRRIRSAGRNIKRMLAIVLLLVASAAAVTGLSGCGSNGFFGQQSHSYTLTITGTSGSLSHSTTVTLIIE